MQQTPSDNNEVYKPILDKTQQISNYQISNQGKILNTQTKKLLNPTLQSNGYFKIGLFRTTFQVHLLVAQYFLENPLGMMCVKHLDGNKQNNIYTNLQYVQQKDLKELKESKDQNQEQDSTSEQKTQKQKEIYETLPDNFVELKTYNSHQFQNLFYNKELNQVIQFRFKKYYVLSVTDNSVTIQNTESKRAKLSLNKLSQLF